jgi:MFS family permease
VYAAIERLTGLSHKDQGPVFLVGLGHGGTHWIIATFYILLPFITRDLGLSYTEAGLLVTLFHASAATANLGSGLVVDVTGRRVLFQVVALAVGAATLFGFVAARHLALLGLLVVVMGATNNLWHPAAISFLSRRYPGNRGYALSIHALGANLGDALAPLAAGAFLLWMSWRGTASMGAVPAFVLAILIALILLPKDTPGSSGERHSMAFGEYLAGVKQLLRDRGVLGLCLMAGVRSMAQNGLLVFLPLYLSNVLRVGPFVMGVALFALQTGGMIASPIAGTWSDRVGRRPVVLAGLTTTTLVIAGLTLIDNDTLFIAGVSLLGFALFAVRPVIHSWLMDLTPANLSGSAISVMFGTQAGLSALVPTVGGIIADIWGLTVVFYLLAAIMLVANVMVYLLPGHRPSASDD